VRTTRHDTRLVECGEVAAELDWPQGGVICVRLTCAGVDCSVDTKGVRDALRVADRSSALLVAAARSVAAALPSAAVHSACTPR
jgi:hypothetical protein